MPRDRRRMPSPEQLRAEREVEESNKITKVIGNLGISAGTQGPTGPQGPQGPSGSNGSQGLQGPQGIQGEIGPQGLQGVQGPQGLTGNDGPQGLQGIDGDDGGQGIQGIQGPQGPAGTTDYNELSNKPTLLALGETSATAYAGDKGKTAYDHSQVTHAPATAEVNVNADWNSSSGDSQILNKPTISGSNTGDESKSTIESKLTGTITTHSHSGIVTPAWKGVLHACDGNGDPNTMLQRMSMHTIEMTPTLLTVSLARVSYFKFDTAITFNKVRYFGIGATTNIHQLALYNGDTLARLWTSGTFTTSAQAWIALGSAINITLAANQLYFVAVSANAAGTTAGIKCYGATTGRLGVVPKNWPASLDVDSTIVSPYGAEAQFIVTTGALPDPAATIAARGTMACGFPAIFLDSNNA